MLEHYDHQILRKVIVGIGTLFNNIYLSRYDSSNVEQFRVKVPLAYAPKQKFVVRARSANEDLVNNVKMFIPRMAFEMKSISYDAGRKNPSTNIGAFDKDSQNLKYRFTQVPYFINFDLHIVCRETQDALQIIEQILPYFTPDFSFTIKTIGVDSTIDIPISLVSTVFDEEYEGDFEKIKVFTATLSFRAKASLFGPTKQSKVILESKVNFKDVFASDFSSVSLGATGVTFETMIFTVTGGATAGNIGDPGTIDSQYILWDD